MGAEVGGELVGNGSVHNQAMAFNGIIPTLPYANDRFHGSDRPAARLTGSGKRARVKLVLGLINRPAENKFSHTYT